jgi:serine/threonine protein kinase/Tfp pilus assembly protein PilF
MKRERWQQVNDLFQSAIERAPEERLGFLKEASRGDERLRRAVERLIAADKRAENFIESPAFEVAPELLTNERAGAMVGELIGHYRVESLIGIGGMGEVYLARDEQLGRKVALKFLPERLTTDKTQLSRFKSEARAASALNHPNILTVHEIGADRDRHFIATEFIEGVTLRASLARGRMNAQDALEIAVQVASALSAAHETGIVHRDIKPENIMIRPDGYVKVLDFGIAKLTEQPRASGDRDVGTTTLLQTHAGLVMGTARYMSPEQTRGQTADARSDIWSLGVVIYEMVSGIPPFSGATTSDCIASVLKTEPPPLSTVVPGVPIEFQSIAQKALRKNSNERYQTVGEMLADFRSLKARLELEASAPSIKPPSESIISKIKRHKRGAALALAAAMLLVAIIVYLFHSVPSAQSPNEKSVAVLPFADLSQARDQEYFCDGIQEEILTRLAKIADLKVISRTSTQRFKSSPDNLREVAKQLGVANLLEGSVQKAADQVRVNVQLISAQTDSHLWAETYDRNLTDIFGVESEIAKRIAESLQAKLTGREEQALGVKPTNNPEAYDVYLRAVAIDNAVALDTIKRVADLYAEAVRLDPQFALAWARLAVARSQLHFNGTDLETNSSAAVKEAADRAMSLQPELGEAWLAQGVYRYRVLRDFQGALESYKEALSRLPNNAFVLEQMAHLERRLGQADVAQKHYQAAAQLDPRDIGVLLTLADTFQIVRRYDEARAVVDRALEISPGNEGALGAKALTFQAEGRLNEAAEILAKAPANSQDESLTFARVTQFYDERRFDEAIVQIQQNTPAAFANDPRTMVLLGYCQKFAGHGDEARATFTRAAAAMKPTPDSVVVVDARQLPCYLAWVYAGLGEKEKALEQARRAINDYNNDALNKPLAEASLAIVEAQVGDIDSAISALPHLLEVPNGETCGDLQLNPLWDPLRKDPRFRKLCQEKQP